MFISTFCKIFCFPLFTFFVSTIFFSTMLTCLEYLIKALTHFEKKLLLFQSDSVAIMQDNKTHFSWFLFVEETMNFNKFLRQCFIIFSFQMAAKGGDKMRLG